MTTPELRGAVRDCSGNPIPNAEVRVRPPTDDAGEARVERIETTIERTETTADGRFSLALPGDAASPKTRATVEVVLAGEVVSEKTVRVSDDVALEFDLDARRTGATRPSEVALPDGGMPSFSMETMMKPMAKMMPHHGMAAERGMLNVPRSPSYPGHGRFGRLFPYLSPAKHPPEFLAHVGRDGGPMEESDDPNEQSDDIPVPAGIVFLGQFIDHDITLDPLSSLSRQNDPDALRNFRTPRLDLDSVYGSGPEESPFLYQRAPMPGTPSSGMNDPEKFLLGENDDGDFEDLPRNSQGVALIGDPRNDENLVISQLQHAFHRFHNAVVDWLRDDPDEEVFEEAQQLVRWHHHWIVLNEFLPAVCDTDVLSDVLAERRYFLTERDDEPYIPVEFAGAVYRFGHGMIRREYEVNDSSGSLPLFGQGMANSLGAGFQPVSSDNVVDWRYFFDIDSAGKVEQSRPIEPKLMPELLNLPFFRMADGPDFVASLASRNLVRGRRLDLPSGQAVARALGEDPLSNQQIGFDTLIHDYNDQAGSDQQVSEETEAPLWYYVLGEADELADGEHLGPVGSRIVAEVLVGLVETDPSSYHVVQPEWTPTLPTSDAGSGVYTMADLLDFTFDYTGTV